MQATTTIQNDDPLFNTPEAAIYLRVHERTPALWRHHGRFTDLLKPIYVGRRVFYRKSALDAFLEARTVNGVAK